MRTVRIASYGISDATNLGLVVTPFSIENVYEVCQSSVPKDVTASKEVCLRAIILVCNSVLTPDIN